MGIVASGNSLSLRKIIIWIVETLESWPYSKKKKKKQPSIFAFLSFFLVKICLDTEAACGDKDSISISWRRELPWIARKAWKRQLFQRERGMREGRKLETRKRSRRFLKQWHQCGENADLLLITPRMRKFPG